MRSSARTSLTLLVAALVVAVGVPASADAARYGSRTLKAGSKGKDVKRLQRYLTKAGHRVHADGQFGAATSRALEGTEQELELRADGRATRREQSAIRRAVTPPTTGGAAYVPPPPVEKVVPGAKGKVDGSGFAVPPASAPASVRQVIAAGNKIAKTPYKWGGGHGKWNDTGYDCSGSVSYALHAAGLVRSPMVSGNFPSWGRAGLGKWISVYANGGHVYMYVAGLRFDTSARKASGSRWTVQRRSNSGFEVTHPKSL